MSTCPRILIVDDWPDVATSLAMLLGFEGFETAVAFDGLQAVLTAREFGPSAVVMDLDMPITDDCNTARRIRGEAIDGYGESPMLVALTAMDQFDVEQGPSGDFDVYLQKPCDPQVVLRLLRRTRTVASTGLIDRASRECKALYLLREVALSSLTARENPLFFALPRWLDP